jgi:hypothetical protein
MTTVNDLHPKAMDLAEEAFSLRRKGQDDKAKRLFLEALELERTAALLLPVGEDSEPSRSILFRSAASLAYNAEDFDAAERLIAFGLSGYPPLEIRDELKNLYDDINFQHHLKAQGITLSTNQWLMSIYGNATSYGGTLVEPLMTRVDRITALFYRTVERLLGVEYRITGSSKKEIKDAYGLYLNAFAPSSFAVSFQIGAPNAQMELIDHKPIRQIGPDSVVDELMECLKLWETGKEDVLKERIENEIYYENFIGIAKQITPDGDDVKQVGFKTVRKGKEKSLTLRKSRVRLREAPTDVRQLEFHKPDVMNFQGLLKFASTPQTKPYGTVHIIDVEGSHSVRVPIGLMKDVVQPYYEELVTVTAVKRGDYYYLEDIDQQRERKK